jgi:hypothetical protein
MPAQGTAPLLTPERPNRPGATPHSRRCQLLNQEPADARLHGPIRVRRHARERR